MKTALLGILLTLYMAYDLNHTFEWNAGAGLTPRVFVGQYLDIAYGQGQGVRAAEEYFAANAVDHAVDAIDRQDGAPIPHQIRQIIADGPTVAVYHHIDAARGQGAMDVVDIYQSARGRITERTRIVQPSTVKQE